MTASSEQLTKKIVFSNLNKLHADIASQLENAYQRVIQSGWFILGKELQAFEHEYASYIGSKHCIGVGNGLDALVLILKALDIGPGDEIIVPTHTYIATWLAVSQIGATLIPVETDASFNIDPTKIDAAISDKTKAIIAVHLYGQTADISSIKQIIGDRSIAIIEDAAQAHGAYHKGDKAGNLGTAAGFSFYPGKNLGALGDGGAITTNDDLLAHKIKILRNYGSQTKYKHEEMGINSRLDELQAAFLRVKLPYLDKWNAKKNELAQQYLTELRDCKNITLPVTQSDNHVWHQFVIRCNHRDRLKAALDLYGIDTLIHYPIPNHLQTAYQSTMGDKSYADYEQLTAEILSLPICPTLDAEDITYICDHIKKLQ